MRRLCLRPSFLIHLLIVIGLFIIVGIKCYRDCVMHQRKTEEGVEAMKNGDWRGAKDSFAAAAKCGGDKIMCLSRQTECLVNMKDYDGALVLCEQLNATPGGEAMGYTFRGVVFEKRDQFAAARLQYEQALAAGNIYAEGNLKILNKKVLAARKEKG